MKNTAETEWIKSDLQTEDQSNQLELYQAIEKMRRENALKEELILFELEEEWLEDENYEDFDEVFGNH